MKHIKIYWIPFVRGYKNRHCNKAVKLLELGWHTQVDFVFIRIFFFEVRITKKDYRTGRFRRT